MFDLPILQLLQDCGDPPFTPQTLQKLQTSLGIRFPDDYSKFLLQFNGGRFTRDVVVPLPKPSEDLSEALITSFIGGLDDGIENQSFAHHMEFLRDRIPEDDFIADEYLPISDYGLVYFLLKTERATSGFGGVWLWNGYAVDDEPSMHWLANTFTEFLSMLLWDICEDPAEQETLPLFQFVERGNVAAVEQYLSDRGDPNRRNRKGQSLLAAAAIYQWPPIVRLLLAHSADPNARDRKGRTPLHHAAGHSIDSVKLLLAAGADPKARDNKGKSELGEWSHRANEILRAHGAEE